MEHKKKAAARSPFLSVASRTRRSRLWQLALAGFLSCGIAASASGAELVRDINDASTALGSLSGGVLLHAAAGGRTYFSMDDGTHGAELWASDGTPAGTFLVKDIRSGPVGSRLASMTTLGSKLVFLADDGVNGVELWTSDGTSGGTQIIADIAPGSTSGVTEPDIGPLVQTGGLIYFVGADAMTGRELWRTDGTRTGTWRVKDIYEGAGSSEPENLTAAGSRIFFAATDAGSGRELWVTDGTSAGTHRVADLAPGAENANPTEITVADAGVYFRASNALLGAELGYADLAGNGAILIDFLPGANGSFPHNLAALGANVIYSAADGAGLPADLPSADSIGELYRSDGTLAGTTLLRDINPGLPNSGPVGMTRLGDRIVFQVTFAPRGENFFWATDGTSTGTVPLGSHVLVFANARMMVPMNGQLFFVALADDSASDIDIWKTDGTPGGTSIFAKLPQPANPGAELVALNGRLYFPAGPCCSDPGIELWSSDGTVAGTRMVKDVNAGAGNGQLTNMFVSNGRVYFFALENGSGVEPWVSDGTEAGTKRLGDFNPRVVTPGSDAAHFATLGARVILTADDGVHGLEPWVADDQLRNVQLLKDISPGAASSLSSSPLVVGGVAYFAARDGSHGTELWRSDGAADGTYMLVDLFPGNVPPPACIPRTFCPPPDASPPPASGDPWMEGPVLNGAFFFSADDGVHGRELWRSDGTPAGTSMVADLTPGPDGTLLHPLGVAGGKIYYCAEDQGAHHLWASDGSASGTVRIAKVTQCYPAAGPGGVGFQGMLYFAGSSSNNGDIELWRTDGTEAGTSRVADLNPGSGSSEPAFLATVGDHIVFGACASAADNCGLYSSDGTASGTQSIPGMPAPTGPASDHGGRLLYPGLVSATVASIFVTDGTVAASREFVPHGLFPNGARAAGAVDYMGKVVFSADDGARGTEIWSSDGTSDGTRILADLRAGAGGSDPVDFTVVGTSLLLDADDGVHGQEPWTIRNGAPTANFDGSATRSDESVSVNVLANDGFIGASSNPSSVTISISPVYGSTSIDPATGAITYQPRTGFSGTDTFAYTVRDIANRVSNAAFVDVIVAAPPGGSPGTAPLPTPAPTPSPAPAPSTTPAPSGSSSGGGGVVSLLDILTLLASTIAAGLERAMRRRLPSLA